MTILLFSIALLAISTIGSYMLGEIGVAITAFLMGIFGYFTYPFLLFCVGLSLRMITGKKGFAGKWVLLTMAVLCTVFFVVHLATSTRYLGEGFGAYLGGCWNAAETSVSDATGGGAVFGIIVYPVQALLSRVGAYLVFSLLIALSVFFFLWATPLRAKFKKEHAAKGRTVEKAIPQKKSPEAQPAAQPQQQPYNGYSQPQQQPYNGYSQPPQQQPYNGYSQPQQQPYNGYSQPQQQPYNGYSQPQQQPYNGYPQPQQQPYNGYSQPQQPYARYSRPQQGRGGAYNAPYMENFDRYTPPMQQSAPVDSMDILYGTDPATSYRSNPIFDKDSRYNTQRRRSSIEPDDSPSRANPRTIPSSFERRSAPQDRSDKYTERYAAQTERPAMPRKIVEQRAPAIDLNYSRQPSYKAPDAPELQQTHGFYDSDVPYEEFSSAPNVDDIEPVSDPEPAPAERSQTELRRASMDPLPEPVKSEPRAESLPATGAPAAQPDEDRAHLRSLFSVDRTADGGGIGFGDRTFGRESANDRTFGRESANERTFGRESADDRTFGRDSADDRTFGRESADDRTFGRDSSDDRTSGADFNDRFDRAFGADEDAGESRVPGGLNSRADMFDDDEPDLGPDPDVAPVRRTREDVHPVPATPAPKPQKHVYRPYNRPSIAIFHQYDESLTVDREEIEQNSQTIIDTLAGFRVDVEVMRVAVGPSVTRYDINIPHNISVGAVTKRDDDVAMRLHARDGVNMYSNNESGFISIEVPNKNRAIVGVRSILQSEEYLKEKPGALTFAIGKDLEGRCVCGNIAKMKHILVAGATGSGKSVCLNAMLISLLCKYSPEELRIILIDPKKVEFAIYDGLPHLMINEIIADAQKAVTALNWAIKEMERRYDLFEQKTRSGVVVRELDEYNQHLTPDEEKLPKIVIVVDELADLMAVAKKDIEERIQRLTQKARAAGIHLVIATQRPSVDVITGVIKGNLPTRMAFRVIQEVDSRTILDESGAQKLLGNGDMLYRTEGMFNCLRVQGAFLSSAEVQAVIEEIKANNEAYFDPAVADYINNTQSGDPDDSDGTSAEEGEATGEYIRALGMVVKLGQASISLIQRKCSIGYNHAGKIIEWMELMGYISPFDGKAKARTVLLTKEEYESKYGPLD